MSVGDFDHVAFARSLRAAMDAAGLSAPALALRAGLSKQSVTNYVNGLTRPLWRSVVAMDDALAAEGLREGQLIAAYRRAHRGWSVDCEGTTDERISLEARAEFEAIERAMTDLSRQLRELRDRWL